MGQSSPERFDASPRIVRSRSRTYKRLPIVAIHGKVTLTENGEMGAIMDLVKSLPTLPQTLFVKYNAADFLGGLDITYKNHKGWQWHAVEREKAICRPDGVRIAARVTM